MSEDISSDLLRALEAPAVIDLTAEEDRRDRAVVHALKMYPQGAGNVANLLSAAKEIEKYLKGEA